MVRVLRAAAAQMGPTQKADTREHTLSRMLALLEEAAGRGASLVVFPELAFTTFFPRWLLEGEVIRIEKAPTMFGLVSCRAESNLNAGFVRVEVVPPPRPVKTILLRAPLPAGWKVESASIDGASAQLIDADTVDLSGHVKPLSVKFGVKSLD